MSIQINQKRKEASNLAEIKMFASAQMKSNAKMLTRQRGVYVCGLLVGISIIALCIQSIQAEAS